MQFTNLISLVRDKFNKTSILFVLTLLTLSIYLVYLNLQVKSINEKLQAQSIVLSKILEGDLPVIKLGENQMSLVSYFNQRITELENKFVVPAEPNPFGEQEVQEPTPEPTPEPIQ